MITLTTPPTVNSVLGGSAPVPYDKMVLMPFTMDQLSQSIAGTVRLTSTSITDMQPIIGSFRVNLLASELIFEAPLLFYRRIVLSGAQKNSILTMIANAQNALESGLISLGVVSGTQGAGT